MKKKKITKKKKAHSYPSNYRPGKHWATDEAWEMLDRLPPGKLEDDYRFLIAGMIAGALMCHFDDLNRRVKALEKETSRWDARLMAAIGELA